MTDSEYSFNNPRCVLCGKPLGDSDKGHSQCETCRSLTSMPPCSANAPSLSPDADGLFVGSLDQLRGLAQWIDEFTKATATPHIDGSDQGYSIDLKALNKVLSTGDEALGCLNTMAAVECSQLIRNLQREITVILSGGIAGVLDLSGDRVRAFERCQDLLKIAVPYFQRLGLRVREEITSVGQCGGVTWQQVRELLLDKKNKGEQFTSQAKLAKEIGCSPATINKTIQNTPDLGEWATKSSASATGMQTLDGMTLDIVPQHTEPDPGEVIEEEDVDMAMQYLLDQAKPDEKAQINAMNPAERRSLAETAFHDPDKADYIQKWRRDRQQNPHSL